MDDVKRSPEELIKLINNTIRIMFAEQLDDPEGLSKSMAQLSSYKRGVSEYLSEAYAQKVDAEREYKYEIAKDKLKFVREGDSATLGESKALIDNHEMRKKWDASDKRVRMLTLAREDVQTNLDTMRSRLATIREDLRNV